MGLIDVRQPKYQAERIEGPTRYSWFVTLVFALFFALSFADRQIIGLLVQPLKSALQLSDVQIGLFGGFSFAVFFALFGIPLGRLADTHNRKRIILFGILTWSAATVLCGFATGFWQLFILRMGVGIGEATLAPCAYSILADMFPRNRLATALSICTMAGSVGIGLAFFGGGVLLQWGGAIAPWRVVFVGLGLPGIVLSTLLFAVREPGRRGNGTATVSIPFATAISYVKANWKTFVTHNVGMGFISITGFAAAFWDIAFFERTYGWRAADSARLYGLLAMSAAVVGALAGGWLADRVTKIRQQDSKLLVLACVASLCIPIRFAYPLMPSREAALVLSVLAVGFVSVPYGIAAAALQLMVPSRMRGQLTALYFFVQQLIGLGIGPTLVGVLTDHLLKDGHMVRYSLMLVGGIAQIAAAILFLCALRPYQATLINAQNEDAALNSGIS